MKRFVTLALVLSMAACTNGGGYEFTVQFTLLTGINEVLIRSGSLLQPLADPYAPITFKKLPNP